MTETRLWNGGTQPLVPHEVGWGHGVVMPGESFVTTDPEGYGPPWTTDPEADQRLREARQQLQQAEQDYQQAEAAEGVSGQQDSPQGVSDVDPTQGSTGPSVEQEPSLHVESNGDVVNESGQVVGHIDSGNPAANTNQEVQQ